MRVPPVLSRWRHAPDRWLHRRRYARATAAVPILHPGDRVLVVCHGNVCRSPFAAALLREALAGTGILVDSAGFVGPGRPVPLHAQVAGLDFGTRLTRHRSCLLTETMRRDARLLLVMDARQQALLRRRDTGCVAPCLLGDFDPLTITKRAIRDPWGQSLPVFVETFARIERCVAVLARALAASRAPSNGAYTAQ